MSIANTTVASEKFTQAELGEAPRIKPEDIEKNILTEYYFSPHDGVAQTILEKLDESPESQERGLIQLVDIHQSLALMTVCVLVLNNGFTVQGVSSCASPANYNEEIGRAVARQNAINQIWPLMGYELRSELAGNIVRKDKPQGDWLSRLSQETNELAARYHALSEFLIHDPKFEELSKTQRDLMKVQATQMAAYLDTLKARLDVASVDVGPR